MDTIYADIAARTGGNIYIGVVGPVRTGKSSLIKRIMETVVIPNIEDPYQRERAKDELPQSASGKTIMTSEPKFVPEEAVEIIPDGTTTLRVRMIDSVGYMVEGAVGATEEGIPRMVTTPWADQQIPMTEAAELGTKKVMQEHCSIGLVVTTDGSVTDIPRQDYIEAEKRAITDMKATGKPFLVVINSRYPNSDAALELKNHLAATYDIEPAVLDCLSLNAENIVQLLQQLLLSFPMEQLEVKLPRWMDALEPEHPAKAALYSALVDYADSVRTLGHLESATPILEAVASIQGCSIDKVDLATGTAVISITFPDALFYALLSDRAGIEIKDDGQLLELLTQLSRCKQEYDKISDALAAVNATGYGIVMPTAEEMKLQTPELIHKNGAYGVKLQAGAPSIHMIRVDIDTQLTPMVGDEKQSRELVSYLSGEAPEKLWESNIFGKSVYDMIQEGLSAKLMRTPQEVREKFRGTLCRIVNEGASGLICLIL